MNFNETIKMRRDYKNPAIYEFLVKTYGIDEKGTNFAPSVYNPHSFSPSDYYGALGEHQAKMLEDSKRKHQTISKKNKNSTK